MPAQMPVAPPLTATKDTPHTDTPEVVTAPKFYSSAELAKIAIEKGVEYAEKLLSFQDKLVALKHTESGKASDAAFAIRNLRDVERKAKEDYATQQQHELSSHRGQNGKITISGQRVGDGKMFLICLYCQKQWNGVGVGPGLLPPTIANQMDNWTDVRQAG